MILLISPFRAQQKIAEHVRSRRLSLNLTQEGLSQRSDVPLATLRKFEQKGVISLQSLLKLLLVVGGLDEIVEALEPKKSIYKSLDDVLREDKTTYRKRGRRV